MRNFLTIALRELQALFTGMIAYVVLFVFFAVSGYFFYIITTTYIFQAMQAMAQATQFGGPPPSIDVTAGIMSSYFGILSTILLFVVPMITMGIFAEEKKTGTIELLFTSPVRNVELILGKFAAVMSVLALMLVPSVIHMLFLYAFSDPRPPLGPVFSGYLGALLLGGTLMAMGLFISSTTENQIVAAVLTFGLFIFLWVLQGGVGTTSTVVNETLRYLSVLNHYDDFTRGVIDSQHLVFYLSFIFLGLYLTSVSLDSVKWRQ